jgi:hypothetical protein
MAYETLDDGTLLTDKAVDTLVMDAYAALDRGAYKVIPNPHKPERSSSAAPLKLSPRRRAELIKALSLDTD